MLDGFFKAKRIAVIGVSREENKIGRIIFESLLGSFNGEVFVVNPSAEEILGYKSYKSVNQIPKNIDMAVIAVKSTQVLGIVKGCIKKKIKSLVIISAGFREIGEISLENKLKSLLKKNKINAIGVNCLGIYDSYSGIDTMFLPSSRMKRPKQGTISFVCQSGAVGSAMLDMMSENLGMSKFISYGNATVIDESDIISYLAKDKSTNVICAYVEGVSNGMKFLKSIKLAASKKPVIIMKAGTTDAGHKAALSHTGALAGESMVYDAAIKQANAIKAETLEEMIDYAKIFETIKSVRGSRTQIITNGGGFGIVSADSLVKNSLKLAELSKETIRSLKRIFPSTVIISNPMDIIGDADTSRYKAALTACLNDKNVDIIFLIVLFQTPLISDNLVEEIVNLNGKKPIVIVSPASQLTMPLVKRLEKNNIPCYQFPENAAKSIGKLITYYKKST